MLCPPPSSEECSLKGEDQSYEREERGNDSRGEHRFKGLQEVKQRLDGRSIASWSWKDA